MSLGRDDKTLKVVSCGAVSLTNLVESEMLRHLLVNRPSDYDALNHHNDHLDSTRIGKEYDTTRTAVSSLYLIGMLFR